MRVAIVGTGYVGLVTGTCLAEFGATVCCVDSDGAKIAALKQGAVPFFEPGLEALIAGNVQAGRLEFSTDLKQGMRGAAVVFIAVGTPGRSSDGHADVSHVHAVARQIAPLLEGYTVVATKSTVPVGTSREVEHIILQARLEAEFDVASNPEFLREGSAIEDFMHPDRVVVGTRSERAAQVLRALYRPLALRDLPILYTTLESSELIKYAANAFLATKVAFINEISDLCEQVGADVQEVAGGIGMDGRIGPKFLHPGPGYGGSCLPKDTVALLRTSEQHGAPLRIVQAVVEANAARKRSMAQRIVAACGGSVQGKRVGILGVTFKPDTDDMRDAPSLEILPALQAQGASIRAHDPKGMAHAERLLPGVSWCADPYAALEGAHAAVILTEWNEYRNLDLERVKALLAAPVLVDLRNVYRPEDLASAGLRYHGVGRGGQAPRRLGTIWSSGDAAHPWNSRTPEEHV